MSVPLVVAAPAKVNLFLHVKQKRADGYHDLESLVAFTAFGDEIFLYPDDGFSLSLSGPFGALLPHCEENLALRAAKLLAEQTGTRHGVRIALRKNLPVASGLGGGSADAAAVLRGLKRLWQLDADQRALLQAAERLGADVPVCVVNEVSRVQGKGERILPQPSLPETGVLLANPGVQVSTAQVFAGVGPRAGTGILPSRAEFADVHAVVQFLHSTRNDLQAPAQAIAPVIADVLRALNDLPGVLLARMSGSGATCFALFAPGQAAAVAAGLLRNRHPEWWVCETTFVDGGAAAKFN